MSIDKSGVKETPWKAEAYVSNASHQAKKFTFLLFINRVYSSEYLFPFGLWFEM